MSRTGRQRSRAQYASTHGRPGRVFDRMAGRTPLISASVPRCMYVAASLWSLKKARQKWAGGRRAAACSEGRLLPIHLIRVEERRTGWLCVSPGGGCMIEAEFAIARAECVSAAMGYLKID